jgi:hypothetical protein
VSAEVYLQSSQAGVNQFHLIFTPTGGSSVASGTPRVVATRRGEVAMALRLVRVGPEHYIAYAVFDPGTWRFTARTVIHGRHQTFSIERVLS